MIPSDWKTASLGEVATFASGGTPSRKNPNYWNGDFPWFSAKDLKSFYLVCSKERITEEGSRNGTRVVEAKTILILVRGMTLLKSFPVGVTTRRSAFNQDLRAVIPTNQLDREFLAYWLSANQAKIMDLVDQAGHGTGRLAPDRLADLEISFPGEMSEQRAIARIVSSWDRGIRQLADLIAAKVRFKRGLMRQLLTGERRFPEFGGAWRKVRLRDVATINAEVLPNNCDLDYKFHYIDLSSVTTGSIHLPETKIRFSEAPSRARRVVRDRDVLLATVRPNLKGFALYRGDGKNIVCSTGFAVISANRPDDSDYLWHLTLSDGVTQQLAGRIAGSNFPAVSASDVENLLVPFPPDDRERDQISRALSLVDIEVTNLRRQLDALKLQKRGLMQKLLRGDVRVKLPEEAA